jgi:hypothetical protein
MAKAVNTYYVVMRLEKEITVTVNEQQYGVALTNDNGLIGALTVFDNEEAALKYAEGKYNIVTVNEDIPDSEDIEDV